MFARDFRKKAWQSLTNNWGIAILAYLLCTIAVAAFVSTCFGALVIEGPLMVGYAALTLTISRREQPNIEQLFSGTKYFVNTFVAGLLVTVYTLLWSLLFIIPGIIKGLGYSMTYFILQDNPGMQGSEAVRRSEEMMYGHKWELFCLQFSFIGWILLCMLTCGLLTLIVGPYMMQAQAEFYRHIKGEQDNTAYAGYADYTNGGNPQM